MKNLTATLIRLNRRSGVGSEIHGDKFCSHLNFRNKFVCSRAMPKSRSQKESRCKLGSVLISKL